MNNPLKVFVVEPRDSGGMIHYAYQMCTALANEGADVTLVTAQNYEMENYPHNFRVNKFLNLWSLSDSRLSKVPSNLLEKIWQKLFWNTRRVFRGLRMIYEWIRLTRYLQKARPDIIQFGKIEFPFEAIFLSTLKHSGLVLTQICHEFELRESSNNPLTGFIDQLYHWVYESFSILFFHAQSNLDRFSSLFKVDKRNLHIIPHGNEQLFLPANVKQVSVDEMRNRYGLSADMPVILFFGILAPSKGIPDLLKAFAIVTPKASKVRLVVAGKPSKHIELSELLGLADELHISETAIFDTRYIPIEEVAPLMEMASVVVYPYHTSTQSGSLQVAYAFGRPVIATNVGGLPEAVDEGQSGFLVPAEDPESLAQAILKFIENPDLAAKMGAHAKHLSKTRFSWNPIAAKILSTYRNYLDQNMD